jgi:predicted nucleic acid-binding protein
MNEAKIVILDTNIVLDLFLFQDPRTAPLREQLQSGQVAWRATQHMRNELERVLAYPHIAAKLSFYGKTAADILAHFDQHAKLQDAPSAKAPYVCKDADDQAFVDLAADIAALQSAKLAGGEVVLISKDKAVLCMRNRLKKLTIQVTSAL